MGTIEIIKGDITKQKVDAIVNAANTTLLGGGGVDGAIHRAAGPELLVECKKIGGCPTGEARLTKGYRLHARYIIHTVGPVWHGGNSNEDPPWREDELLASCYRQSVALAAQNQIRTLAFPSISTGAYRFPVKRASQIAIQELQKAVESFPTLERVYIVAFDQNTFDVYQETLNESGV